jgi:hypothetical protein
MIKGFWNKKSFIKSGIQIVNRMLNPSYFEEKKDQFEKQTALLKTKFKGSAPVLYQKYKKINNIGNNSRVAPGGYDRVVPEYASHGGYDREYDYNREGGYDREYDYNREGGYDREYNDMYGGNKDAINPALEELRMDIERYKYFSGGNSDNELELLRDEINKMRNL